MSINLPGTCKLYVDSPEEQNAIAHDVALFDDTPPAEMDEVDLDHGGPVFWYKR